MRELSLHILDAMQNSLEAGATQIELTIDEDLGADRLAITIRDNGRGMDDATLARITDPFFTTRESRHVGLGIPLFQAATERCHGSLAITSQMGVGTTLMATFQHSHIDRSPLGDVTGTLVSVILGGTCDVHYRHRIVDGRQVNRDTRIQAGANRHVSREHEGESHNEVRMFEFNTAEIKAELGDVPLTHPDVRRWLLDFIAEGEAELALR